MVRQPAVAGRFYPAEGNKLSSMIDGFLVTEPAVTPRSAAGLVVPHAGYMYSGRIAGEVYAAVQVPPRVLILCPNHTGYGVPLSIMRAGAWRTPLGDLPLDSDLADALIQANPALEEDAEAHRFEHAIEVQLPFLQRIAGTNIRFVPIVVGTGDWETLRKLGESIARTIASSAPPTLMVASTDMNHYEPDDITRIKDAKAIEPMRRLDARDLHETVLKEEISMCGFGPATAMLVAARMLGAERGELVRYATSADVSGDFERVVGYAGMVMS